MTSEHRIVSGYIGENPHWRGGGGAGFCLFLRQRETSRLQTATIHAAKPIFPGRIIAGMDMHGVFVSLSMPCRTCY